jgi:hypothetical protein
LTCAIIFTPKNVNWPENVANWPLLFSNVARPEALIYKGLRALLARWPHFFTINYRKIFLYNNIGIGRPNGQGGDEHKITRSSFTDFQFPCTIGAKIMDGGVCVSEAEYGTFYKIDARDEWICGAYDEDGDQVYCDACGDELKWNPESRTWQCKGCGNTKSRIQFFDFIGANPPGKKCLSQCMENYPFCKDGCPIYR